MPRFWFPKLASLLPPGQAPNNRIITGIVTREQRVVNTTPMEASSPCSQKLTSQGSRLQGFFVESVYRICGDRAAYASLKLPGVM